MNGMALFFKHLSAAAGLLSIRARVAEPSGTLVEKLHLKREAT